MNIKIQKVKSFKDELKKKTPSINGSYIITEKYDGWFGYCYHDIYHGWNFIRSSSGRVIPSIEYFNPNKFLNKLGKSGFLIFEIIIPGISFEKLNGILNRKYEEAEDVIFMVHDFVPVNMDLAAITRYNKLSDVLKDINNNPFIKTPILGITEISKTSLHLEYLNSVLENGGEGIILKRADAFYSFGKRNADLLKMKAEITLDLKITAVYKSTGDKGFEAYNLNLKNGPQNVSVVVPKHSDIEYIESQGDNLIGTFAEISAMEILDNGSLRHPIFKHFRYDLKDK